jgi:hypothetical protein
MGERRVGLPAPVVNGGDLVQPAGSAIAAGSVELPVGFQCVVVTLFGFGKGSSDQETRPLRSASAFRTTVSYSRIRRRASSTLPARA